MTIASLGYGIGAIAAYAVIGLALMLAGFYVIDWTTPGKLSQLVRDGRPNAAVVTASGLAKGPHSSTLLGVSMLGYGGQLVEITAVAVVPA